MIVNPIFIISNLTNYLVLLYFFNSLLNCRVNKKLFVGVVISLFTINVIVNSVFEPGIHFIIYSLLSTICVSCLYKASWSDRITLSLSFIALLSLSEILVFIITNKILSFSLSYWLQVGLVSVVKLILLSIFIKLKSKSSFFSKQPRLYYSIFSVLLVVDIVIVAFEVANISITTKQAFILIMLIIIFFILLLILFLYHIDNNNEKIKMANLKQQLERKGEFYELVLSHENNIRKIKHDLNNRLASALIGKGDLNEEIKKVISEIEATEYRYCNDPFFNFLLSMKLSKLKIDKENLKIYVSLKQEVKILNSDLAIIIGNSLDNAIDALNYLEISKRELSIWIKLNLGVLNMEIKNTYDPNQVKSSSHEGLGLKSIEELANKYDGYVEIEKDKYFNLFVSLMNNSSNAIHNNKFF